PRPDGYPDRRRDRRGSCPHQREGENERRDGLSRQGGGHRRPGGGSAGGVLIESLVERLAELPPVAVYAVLALLAAAENVLPPLPADTAVAVGAFLSHRGLTTPLGVFLVVWAANSRGAAAIYFTARRYGRGLFASPTGRR